ncbi:MAG: phosphatase PAP2 family protein [Bacteroidota bacterium]|jgi:membrane-associated phospholipid phosphatase
MIKINRWVWVAWLSIAIIPSLRAQTQQGMKDSTLVPFTRVFFGMDKNLVGSFAYNYGLNYAVAGAGTYGIVQSGIDWRWYRNAHDHTWIMNAGFVPVGIGPLASVAVPLGLYLYGRSEENAQLQLTGLALGQAALLGAVISSGLKAFTGRVPPDNDSAKSDYSGNFRFGLLRGGVYEGWPSSHTATAFAMAVTLIKLYPDNATIRIGGLAYASLIGLGVSTNIHWLSDAFAGALIGYAIGEAVGGTFRTLAGGNQKDGSFNFSVTPTGVGFTYRF